MGQAPISSIISRRIHPDPSYDRPVTDRARVVLATALRLTVDERAELVAELLASLDGEPDTNVEAAWAAEIERRARRVLRDGPSGPTWDEVRAELRRRLAEHRDHPDAVMTWDDVEHGLSRR